MFRGDLTESAEVMKLKRELKIFERENGPAISLKKKSMEDMGLEIGDTLIYAKYEDGIVIRRRAT